MRNLVHECPRFWASQQFEQPLKEIATVAPEWICQVRPPWRAVRLHGSILLGCLSSPAVELCSDDTLVACRSWRACSASQGTEQPTCGPACGQRPRRWTGAHSCAGCCPRCTRTTCCAALQGCCLRLSGRQLLRLPTQTPQPFCRWCSLRGCTLACVASGTEQALAAGHGVWGAALQSAGQPAGVQRSGPVQWPGAAPAAGPRLQ